MAVRIRQSTRMGWYLMRQRLAKRERFPLIVELEPLFQCNLACSGCGKIQHPEHELRRRMPVEQAIGAIEESGAPMVNDGSVACLSACSFRHLIAWSAIAVLE